jgi:hypothetical protein
MDWMNLTNNQTSKKSGCYITVSVLWGCVKSVAYTKRICDSHHLHERIYTVVAEITLGMVVFPSCVHQASSDDCEERLDI